MKIFVYKYPMKQALQDVVLAVLDTTLKHEPKAMESLIEYRVPVSKAFLDVDSPVVVQVDDVKTGANPQLGLLGIINGFLGEEHKICAVFEQDGRLTGFKPVE